MGYLKYASMIFPEIEPIKLDTVRYLPRLIRIVYGLEEEDIDNLLNVRGVCKYYETGSDYPDHISMQGLKQIDLVYIMLYLDMCKIQREIIENDIIILKNRNKFTTSGPWHSQKFLNFFFTKSKKARYFMSEMELKRVAEGESRLIWPK